MGDTSKERATLSLAPCHGTRLTDQEVWRGVDAAWAVFGAQDPRTVYEDFQRLLEANDQAGMREHLWQRAEDAAVRAATQGWARCPEGLVLQVF